MTIEKLPSGKYRIKQMVDGTTYRITVDHKPTQTEAMKLITKKMEDTTIDCDMPLDRAIRLYIEQKSNVLSVSTVRGYKTVMRQISPSLLATKISAITLPMVQNEVNRYAKDHSVKSVYNLSGLIMGVLKYYGVTIRSPKLPQKEKKPIYIPTEDEVKSIFAYFKGTKYEIPLLLSAMGLRRSEICALTPDDLDGNVLTVNKAKVIDENGDWHIKSTKTAESTRTIVLPDYLANLIRERGVIYEGHPETILKYLKVAQKELGIPTFSLHKMRHFFASYMHNMGYTDKQIQDMGGWKTDNVMKTVYTHSMELEKAKERAAADLGGLM